MFVDSTADGRIIIQAQFTKIKTAVNRAINECSTVS